MNGASWTAERIETLGKLWGEGYSASNIAKRLGGITRNAVIGKVHRLGLAGRKARHRLRVAQVRTTPRTIVRHGPPLVPAPIVAPRPDVIPEPVSLGLPVIALRDDTCRWPHGDPLDGFAGFCGHTVADGSSYCPHHHRRVYRQGTVHGR